MKGERLELVTDFGSLKTGMIVVVKGKDAIECRVMLMNKEPYQLGSDPWCFAVEPNRAPSPHHHVLSPEAVRRRLVYRVVDGLEQTAESRKTVTA